MNQPLRAFFASSIGTIFEWYDFMLFAYLTPLISQLFFPHENAYMGLMLTYSVFAIGFLVRPLGAALFGHIGDRRGRKISLTYTIVLMSVATCLMGVLPTYSQGGMLAPVLLILLRIGQGLSAGGESTGASLFILESVSDKRRGLIGALLWSVVGVGMLLGSLAATLVTHSSLSWGWRIPFLLGALTGVIGYFVRMHTSESTEFLKVQSDQKISTRPLWEGITHHKHALTSVVGLYCLSSIITYLVFVFMPNYATSILKLPASQTSLVTTVALFMATLLVPFGGYLSDRIGRRQCLFLGASAFLVLSYPLFHLMSQGNIKSLILAESIFVLCAICYQGPLTAASFELLPTRVRYSMVALGYNLSYSLFGGTAPLVATYLVHQTGHLEAPGFYLIFGATIALFAILNCKSTINQVPV